jgi:hypothetical protein
VPELQRRGRFHIAYTGRTLRENSREQRTPRPVRPRRRRRSVPV